MKEEKYSKSLAKNRVYAIVHMQDIRKNVSPKFIMLCVETLCLCPGGVLPYMGYIGMCRCEGYGFQAVYSRIGYKSERLGLE